MKSNLAEKPIVLHGPTVRTGGSSVLDKHATPELVIALCGPLGTPLHQVARKFRQVISKDYSYTRTEIIRLSDFLKRGLPQKPSIAAMIAEGNRLREMHGNAYLAALAIKDIYAARSDTSVATGTDEKTDEPSTRVIVPTPLVRHCHIIDSIKNGDELRLLRSVYGEMLYVVGVYAPIEKRIENLEGRTSGESVETLIDRDSGEEASHGQQVGETYPQADFFLRTETGTDAELDAPIKRFLDLLFGAEIITPTKAERAMYAAYSAARNSACLSRQVGASIADEAGTVIATGWNDVPRPFGGLYEEIEDRKKDQRCWNHDGGYCYNDAEKDLIADQMIEMLVRNKLISGKKIEHATKLLRQDTKLKSLIEFSRAVHAEMHAILNAGATAGTSVNGSTLYVTTYPCHSCARHLIAAGIREVIFLEPYRKSLATKLHKDAITENEDAKDRVRLLPYNGVAPSRFLTFFSSWPSGRKDSKTGLRIDRGTPTPVSPRQIEALRTLELIVIRELNSASSTPPAANDQGSSP
ncbi:cytidine and deoxycytidylate deaminase zinc-binding region [Bordetella hinzii 1277]|uniref:anti-phage dCTP deaminase n=1 Tax=Bordetella hinzii TaxID=103855 RepID=UPI000459E0A5|nr:anti-phage dCTP deaminase [Bordetella hinzii]KCB48394.1 cytidine and deoxycytidylate deaminase zinc-binding region [Bordetella hinzii 1277]